MPSNQRTSASDASGLLAAFFDAADVLCGVFELEADDYRYAVVNPATAAFYDKRPEELIGRSGREMGLSESQIGRRMRTLHACWREKRSLREEYRFDHAGRAGWFMGSFTPLEGERPRVGFVLLDITRQKAAERALADQGQTLQVALASAELGLWEYDARADVMTWDQRMRRLFGVADDEAVDFERYAQLLHPKDRAQVLAAYAAAREGAGGGAYQVEHRTHDGRWIRASGQVVFSSDGTPRRAVGTARDITAERTAREHEQLLVAELNHRVKNNLAAVQSIAMQTARNTPDLDGFMAAFEGRLLALARTHDVLTASAWSGADLASVLERQTAVFGPQVSSCGPPVPLGSQQTLALGMIIHELSTNAAKYGALAVPGGSVSVTWTLAADQVRLTWAERGGAGCETAPAEGFGSRLIRRLAKGELRGEINLAYRPEGLVAKLSWTAPTS